MSHYHVYPTGQQTAAAAAKSILGLLEERLSGESYATLAVSGGKSPTLMFAEMVKASFDWSAVHLFWVDERGVPPNHPQSNFLLVEEHLIKPARIPVRNIHRVHGELKADEAAARYANEIRSFFGLKNGELPAFDVVHQGVGPDAHTASLFPGDPLIEDRENLAAAVYVEKMSQWRITLLPGVLQAARQNVMYVTGADKAPAVRSIFHEPYDPIKYPAQIIAHHGRSVSWFLDQAAAKLMD